MVPGSRVLPRPSGMPVALAFLALLSAGAHAQTCADPKATDFKKETLANGATLSQPVGLAVAKNGLVFVAQRTGEIMVYDPASGKTGVAGKLNSFMDSSTRYDVGGPLGVAVSPDFPEDDWVYVYYAYGPSFNGVHTKEGGKLTYRLSRFHFVGGTLDLPREEILLEVPSIWETHNSGNLKFGKDGNLWLSVGDNHDHNCSSQYSPMDERNSWCDDQGTTANTNELRGKVLRIHPEAQKGTDGKYYTIPAGNLKEKYLSLWPDPADQAKVKPEIYTMGHRNPYRIFPDPVTGRLYIGEFGPAAADSTQRGPSGADQLRVTDEPANFGYPYFLKNNQPYCHWDYAASKCLPIQGQADLKYIASKPVNYSPNNTGVNILPPAKPSSLWNNDNGLNDPIPGLSGCGIGAGPVYHFDPSLASPKKFPPSLDDKWILFSIAGGGDFPQPKLATPPAASFGMVPSVTAPPWGNLGFKAYQQDMLFGADGALYVLDYGSNSYNDNDDDGLYRVSYTGCLPAVSLAGREKLGHAHVALQAGNERLTVPQGAVGISAFAMSGRKIWEAPVAQGDTYVTMPAGLGRGMYRILWR